MCTDHVFKRVEQRSISKGAHLCNIFSLCIKSSNPNEKYQRNKKTAWPQNNQRCPIESKTYIVYLQYLLEITRYVIRKEVINSPVPSNDLIDLCGKTTCLYTSIGSVSDACDMLRKQVQYLRLLITEILIQIARFVRPRWGPHGADRTQVGPMLAPWTLLPGNIQDKSST